MNTRVRFAAGGAGSGARRLEAFTMVEIALCLGVIAIALVAIIGVLPTGIRVQKDNRDDTIIQQDGAVLLEAIRSGAWGLDYLTNHVHYIDVHSVDVQGRRQTIRHVPPDPSNPSEPDRRMASPDVQLVPDLRSGLTIISLLSTNRLSGTGRFTAINSVEALIRPLSGPAWEKSRYSFTNQANSFMYYMYLANVEVLPLPVPPPYLTRDDTNFTQPGLAPDVVVARSNTWVQAYIASNETNNFSDLRVTLQGVFLRGSNTLERVGASRTFRAVVPGRKVDPWNLGHPVFKPQNFLQVGTTGLQ